MAELDGAEAWERELHGKLVRVEQAAKPPLLQLYEKLDRDEDVEEELLLNVFKSSKGDLLKILKERVRKVRLMERPTLVKMVDFLLRARHLACYEESFCSSSVNEIEALLRGVVREIGRLDISWVGIADWEVITLKRLMREMNEEVPSFLIRLVTHLLQKSTKKEVAVQTV